jgi:succinate dehydrogenase/fumarate reductase flavoprotein subunit
VTDELPIMSVDVLVLGTGMAGSTVSARAAEAGASVLVVDVADSPGGSAALSGGNVWTAATAEDFLIEDPSGDVALWKILRDDLTDSLDWIESLGVASQSTTPKVHDAPVGRKIDIVGYLKRCRRIVETSPGCSIAYRTTPSRLLVNDGVVTGAVLSESGRDISVVNARAVVLATGGFQANPQRRNEYLFDGAESLLLRGNLHSRGDGIELARQVGAGFTDERRGFYGQLVPSPLAMLEEPQFRSLAMFFSVFGLLVREDGRRWIDESLGSHKNADAVGRAGRCLLIIDEQMRQAAYELFGTDPVDVLQQARSLGCNVAQADSLEQLAPILDSWRYPSATVLDTVEAFGRALSASGAGPVPPRSRYRIAAQKPPFWATEVQAAITIAYGGLLTDLDGRVLREDRTVIPGLFAAGLDAAGPNVAGYTGSLVRGLVFGRRVARAITSVR